MDRPELYQANIEPDARVKVDGQLVIKVCGGKHQKTGEHLVAFYSLECPMYVRFMPAVEFHRAFHKVESTEQIRRE